MPPSFQRNERIYCILFKGTCIKAFLSIVNTTTLHPPSLAMTSIAESEAHFTKRMEEIGVTDRGKAAITTAGYTTLGHLALGVGQPGVPVPEQEFGRNLQPTC